MSFCNPALFSTNTQSLVPPGQGHVPTQHVGSSSMDLGYYDGLAHLPFQQFDINMPSTAAVTVPNPFSVPNMSASLKEARIRLGRECLICTIELPLPILAPTAWKTIALHKLVPSLTMYFKMSAQSHGRKDNFYFCPDCCHYPSLTGPNRVNQFLMSLTELEESIQELKVIIQAQLQRRLQQSHPKNVATGTGTENIERLLNKGLELQSSFDRYVTENAFGDQDTTSLSLDSPPVPACKSDSDGNRDEESAPEPERKNSVVRLKKSTAKPALRRIGKTRSQNRPKRVKSNLDAEPSSPFVCETCGIAFKRRQQLASHKRLHTGEKPFTCKECGQRFRHYPAMSWHLKRHAGIRAHKCEACDRTFVTKWSLRVHMRVHTLEKPYKCPCCEHTSSQRNSIDAHVARVHPEHAAAKYRPEDRFKCSACPKTFLFAHRLKLHELGVHRVEDRQIQCENCGKKFVDNSNYKRHVAEVHMGLRGPIKKPHECPECGKLFRTPSDLGKHAPVHVPKGHAGIRAHKCEACDRTFVTKWSLRVHMRVHTLEKPYKCPCCEHTSNQRNSIDAHVARVHPEHAPAKYRPEDRFKCSACPKTFLFAHRLKLHELGVHRVEDRQIQCETCGKKFVDNSNCKRHVAEVHMGLRGPIKKPHECPECGKLFRTPSELGRHAPVHVPKAERKRFSASCDICSRTFLFQRCLTKHLKRHELEGPILKKNRSRRSKKVSTVRGKSNASLVKECKTKPVTIRLKRVNGSPDADVPPRESLRRAAMASVKSYNESESNVDWSGDITVKTGRASDLDEHDQQLDSGILEVKEEMLWPDDESQEGLLEFASESESTLSLVKHEDYIAEINQNEAE